MFISIIFWKCCKAWLKTPTPEIASYPNVASKYSYNEVQYFRSNFIQENQITHRNSKPIKRVRSSRRFLRRTRGNRRELVTISSRFTSDWQAKEHVSLRASEPADQPIKTYKENQLNQS